MRIANLSRSFFAATLIGIGILGLIRGDFTALWDPVPKDLPARDLLVYLCAGIGVACGVGLLVPRTATLAARVLFFYSLLWLLLFRVPPMVVSFAIDTWWSACKTSVMTASAWVLYVSLADDWDKQRLGFICGDTGLRIARVLYGVALIPFGIAHFMYVKQTAVLVPGWLPGTAVFWAYFTGGAYIAAGVAIAIGVFARLVTALSAWETGLITLLVWVPMALVGQPNAFQWGEVVVSIALSAAAWVVAGSYRSEASAPAVLRTFPT
jgi:uncharacterized membrane protein